MITQEQLSRLTPAQKRRIVTALELTFTERVLFKAGLATLIASKVAIRALAFVAKRIVAPLGALGVTAFVAPAAMSARRRHTPEVHARITSMITSMIAMNPPPDAPEIPPELRELLDRLTKADAAERRGPSESMH